MSTRYWRKKAILAKIETVYATDPTPTGAANAILMRDVEFTPFEAEYVERDIAREFLGHQDQIVATVRAKLTYKVEMAGSGTAGVAPPWGPLVRACALAEYILAAAHAGTAQAGGASTITLAAAASATNDAYRGMRIRTTGGTGTGQARVISTYVGATKVATVSEAWITPPDITTTYSIDAQVAYLPVSSSMESVTKYFNMDGKRHLMLGARGTMGVSIMPRALPMFTFEFEGLWVAPTDTALPTQTLTGWKTPKPVTNTNTTGFTLHGLAAKMYALELNLANQKVYRNLPGVEDVQITDRAPAGSVTIEDPTLAEKNYFTIASASTLGALSVLHGTAAGNQVHVHAPAVQLTQPKFENKDSVIALAMATRLIPLLGNDELSIQAL